MKLLGFAYIYLAGLLVNSAAQMMVVNYYSDFNCSKSVAKFPVTWADPIVSGMNCYNYNLGQNSVKITDCSLPGKECVCQFFDVEGCPTLNSSAVQLFSGDPCFSTNTNAFVSFGCYYGQT
ncbi:hypothetical protein V8E54_009855 [Elaphomyces granulatus]